MSEELLCTGWRCLTTHNKRLCSRQNSIAAAVFAQSVFLLCMREQNDQWFHTYGPFARNGHMVQNPPWWRATSLLFPRRDIKTKASQGWLIEVSLFQRLIAGIIMSLPSSTADFVPCNRLFKRPIAPFSERWTMLLTRTGMITATPETRRSWVQTPLGSNFLWSVGTPKFPLKG